MAHLKGGLYSQPEQLEASLTLVDRFATIITAQPILNTAFAPVELSLSPTHLTLRFHLSRANPVAQSCLSHASPAHVILHGPHTHITPMWYEPNPSNVPTWDYLVVKATGVAREADLDHHLDGISRVFEAQTGWRYDAHGKGIDAMRRLIVCLEVVVERKDVEVIWKMSENRKDNEKRMIIRGLKERGSEMDLKVAEMIARQVPAETGVKYRMKDLLLPATFFGTLALAFLAGRSSRAV